MWRCVVEECLRTGFAAASWRGRFFAACGNWAEQLLRLAHQLKRPRLHRDAARTSPSPRSAIATCM